MSWQLYQYICLVWMALGLATFFYLLRVQAPFGRHVRAGWGPTINNRLGWVLMELTVLIVLYLVFFNSRQSGSLTTPMLVMLGLFTAHYVHRSLIFPQFLRTRGKRMPLIIALSAMGFNCMNGFLFGYFFGRFADYPAEWLSDFRFQSGFAIFLSGAAINVYTDYKLIGLRKPGDTGYKIPQGGLFNYLSCPNHFGEIMEWIGFAVLSWSLPGLAFAFWTFANLAPRALAHHRWYQEQFPEYPAGRKAVLPFFW
ncbi:MAG: DUF1295 domain-containing protein [Saprospiraceae bacterium]